MQVTLYDCCAHGHLCLACIHTHVCVTSWNKLLLFCKLSCLKLPTAESRVCRTSAMDAATHDSSINFCTQYLYARACRIFIIRCFLCSVSIWHCFLAQVCTHTFRHFLIPNAVCMTNVLDHIIMLYKPALYRIEVFAAPVYWQTHVFAGSWRTSRAKRLFWPFPHVEKKPVEEPSRELKTRQKLFMKPKLNWRGETMFWRGK